MKFVAVLGAGESKKLGVEKEGSSCGGDGGDESNAVGVLIDMLLGDGVEGGGEGGLKTLDLSSIAPIYLTDIFFEEKKKLLVIASNKYEVMRYFTNLR